MWPNPVKDAFPVLVEGSWVVRHGDYYYLFYSGDNCCGAKANYAVMVARSKSATGPFETLEQATGKPHSIILEKRGHWFAPGHNSIVTDARRKRLDRVSRGRCRAAARQGRATTSTRAA